MMSLFYQFHPAKDSHDFAIVVDKKALIRHCRTGRISDFISFVNYLGFNNDTSSCNLPKDREILYLQFHRDNELLNFRFNREGLRYNGLEMGILENVNFGFQDSPIISPLNVKREGSNILSSLAAVDLGNFHYWAATRVQTPKQELLLRNVFSAWANS